MNLVLSWLLACTMVLVDEPCPDFDSDLRGWVYTRPGTGL